MKISQYVLLIGALCVGVGIQRAELPLAPVALASETPVTITECAVTQELLPVVFNETAENTGESFYSRDWCETSALANATSAAEGVCNMHMANQDIICPTECGKAVLTVEPILNIGSPEITNVTQLASQVWMCDARAEGFCRITATCVPFDSEESEG